MKVKLPLLVFLGISLCYSPKSLGEIPFSLNTGVSAKYGPPGFLNVNDGKYLTFSPHLSIQTRYKKFRMELGLSDLMNKRDVFIAGDPVCGMGNNTPYVAYYRKLRAHFELGLQIFNTARYKIEWVNGLNFSQSRVKTDLNFEHAKFNIWDNREQILAWHTGIRYSTRITEGIQAFIQVEYSSFSSGFYQDNSWSEVGGKKWRTQQLQQFIRSVAGISIRLN